MPTSPFESRSKDETPLGPELRGPLLVDRPVRQAGIPTIVKLANAPLRNLWITLAYHDLARGMTSLLTTNLSWCAFSTWASKTAGASIRSDLDQIFRDRIEAWLKELPGFLGEFGRPTAILGQEDRLATVEKMLSALDEEVATVSMLIADGNLTVFRELGPPFAGMVMWFDNAGPPFRGFDAFLETVVAIDGNPEATTQLRTAFRRYYAALCTSDPKSKAECVLLANGLIGLTEQIRLQPFILKALNAPVDRLRKVLTEVGPLLTRGQKAEWRASDLLVLKPIRWWLKRLWGWVRQLWGAGRGGDVIDLLVREMQRVWREAVSKLLLTLELPDGGALALSDDVPIKSRPVELETIDDPELRAFLAKYDRTRGTAEGSRARDWADLDQRMNYIVNLFHYWQQTVSLLDAPFSADQIQEMQASRMPDLPR